VSFLLKGTLLMPSNDRAWFNTFGGV